MAAPLGFLRSVAGFLRVLDAPLNGGNTAWHIE